MYFTGIDMGSTCTKLIVLDEGGAIAYKKVVPTGWNCVETAKGLIDELAKEGFAGGYAYRVHGLRQAGHSVCG